MSTNIGGKVSASGGAGIASKGKVAQVLATLSTANINSGAVQNVYVNNSGLKAVIEKIVLRDPTANAALIEGSLGVIAACTSFAAFAPQTNLTGAGKMSVIYPSSVGGTAELLNGETLGLLLSTLAGVAGTMTVEVIGRLV